VVLAVFVVFPQLAQSDYIVHLGAIGLIYATVAVSWDLTLGYGGVFNFAHPALFGLGAYASGVAAAKFGVEPWAGLVVGAVVAAVVSVAVFVPVSRLRGIYVALITFAAAQLILYVVITQTDLTGGYLGLTDIPMLSLGSFDFGRNEIATYYLAGVLLLFAIALLRRMVTSDYGLGLVGLRDFEEYAVSRGVSVGRQRLWAFIASGALAGAAGGIYTFYLLSISPEIFGFSLSTLLLSMVLVGGIATIFGPAVAAIALTYISDALSPLGAWRFIAVGVLIIIVILFFPAGIWGALVRRGRRGVGGPLRGAVVSASGSGAGES
jgi:branched-chain amino acid transport system permease protein